MSRQDVEAFERAIAAFNRRDLDALLEEFDPAVEINSAIQQMLGGGAGVYHGHAGMTELMGDFADAFAEIRIEIAETRDLDAKVLGTGSLHGRGSESGAEVVSPLAMVFSFRNGKATLIDSYLDPDEALRRLGLRD